MDTPYIFSTDKTKLDTALIHTFLTNESYWAKGRSYKTVKTSIENSLCFGVYDADTNLVGFARVVSDHSVFAQILDVFVVEEHRKKGLGSRLIEYIIQYPQLQGLQRWGLNTLDAHNLYSKFGFKTISDSNSFMEMVSSPK